MSRLVIQTSFNSGEWAPALNARVDLAKYHSGAALLRNWFVDYRGGATLRGGTRYVLQTNSTGTVRVISFQASFSVSFVLEFGQGYIRFLNNGSPVLEAPKTITGISQANPGVLQSAAHGFANGDWVYIAGVVGMTQVNGNYYIVRNSLVNSFDLHDLNNVNLNTTAYTAYVSGGTVSRVYTLVSPYQAADLAQIKFAQNVNTMVLCHPNYPPYQLVLTSAANWSLAAITFGSTVAAPTGQSVATTLAAGTWNYAYIITAVDSNGQESGPSAFATLAARTDMRTVAGTNTVTWSAVTGAASYNVYKAILRDGAAVPAGAQFGFAGNCTTVTFIDSNIGPDFSQCAPIAVNPFSGTGIQSITITNAGSYAGLTVPIISFTGGAPGTGAAATAVVQAIAVAINTAGAGYAVFDTITIAGGVVLQVISVNTGGVINAITIVNPGSISTGPVPANPSGIISTSGGGSGATFNITWGVTSVGLTSPGTAYTPTPAVVFSTGAAAATATLGAPSSGNPTIPSYFQQRLVLAGPVSNPQQFNMSQPGAYYNFNVSNPVLPDNAFQGTLVSGQLNTIQSLISQPQGLVTLSDKSAWLINGGSAGSGVDATNTVANAHTFAGAASLPPIVAADDILYVQSKGSIVRDLVFNFDKQVYTGTDISVMSSHLFYGYQLLEWCWAEEPFKIVWAVRNDGILLSLTYLKDQALIAWAHHDTQGAFKSIASVTETVALGSVDAVYVVVQRTINGTTLQYIERMTEVYYPRGVINSWFLDAGINYTGPIAVTFTGAQHLAGMNCVGVADGIAIAFTMPVSGTFVFGIGGTPGLTAIPSASVVTVGLPIIGQLQTLPLDIGEPTVQGKMKKISDVTVRCQNALGLTIGRDFTTQTEMKDLVRGNVGSNTNVVVTDLVTGDAQTIVDPKWDTPGQYCIQQTLPYPASVLGVIPDITISDDKDRRQ